MANTRGSDTFHSLAKDAGNRLRVYVLSIASGGITALFFLLTGSDDLNLTCVERVCLLVALICFSATGALCLLDLRIDARRFYAVAKELEKNSEDDQNWDRNDQMKALRPVLIHISYVTLGVAVLSTGIFLISKLFRAT